jgi:hypothetical protein
MGNIATCEKFLSYRQSISSVILSHFVLQLNMNTIFPDAYEFIYVRPISAVLLTSSLQTVIFQSAIQRK